MFFPKHTRDLFFNFGIATMVVLIYFGSYTVFRSAHLSYQEIDGCPPDGCQTLTFPDPTSYWFYAPLWMIDERLSHFDVELN